MVRQQQLFLIGAFALGIFGSLPAPWVGRLGVGIGFALLLSALEFVPLSRRLRFGIAAGLPLLVWIGIAPSASHGISLGTIALWATVLWWCLETPRRWRFAYALLAVFVGLARVWQECLGYGLAPWNQLLGLGVLAIVGIYLMGERQKPWLDRLLWNTRHFAHDLGTPLHVIQFCAQQWLDGQGEPKHAERLLESANRASDRVRRHRVELGAWFNRQPILFSQVWDWVTEDLEGGERFTVDSNLAQQLWDPQWVDEAGRSLRLHVSNLSGRFGNLKFRVEMGPRPPNLHFFTFEEIAISEIKKEGGACKKQCLVSRWRGK